MKVKPVIRDGLITIGISGLFFCLSYYLQIILKSEILLPAILILGVFTISILTSSYQYGIIASIISVLEQNFAFTFPYFKLNFTLLENVLTAIIMVIIALITCSLTIRLKTFGGP